MKFIDAHHHLWDLDACRYPWLETRGIRRFFGDPTPIQQNYLLDDFLGESARYRPLKSVHIQVGAAPGDEIAETRWIAERDSKPEALVCFVDLVAPDRESTLDSQCQFERVRGVRHIIGRHREEDKKHGSDHLIDDPEFLLGLKSLARRKLRFDCQLIPEQHHRVAALLARVENLPIAVCHAGSPWDQTPKGLEQWAEGMKALAALPLARVKLSGLGMFNPGWKTADIEPIVMRTIDIFGPGRVMVGSNFPVDKLYHGYKQWWEAVETLLDRFSPDERHQMLVSTAEQFYDI